MPAGTYMKESKTGKKPCGCGQSSGGKHAGCGCKGDCGCHGKASQVAESCGGHCECHPDVCCDLACLSRPNYFCGHLLTDEDLRLEHRYFAEKLKMYHRTLHGDGVVCGLPLSCEPDCCGWIRIGEGYAIDDCGRDLVVCSSLKYDLLGELKRRGWVLCGPEPDPCHPEEKEDGCPDTQCFYIYLQYKEKQDTFTTPLRGACHDGPSACEPTRVHESVCVEVSAKKPGDLDDPLSGLELGLEEPFRLLEKSLFGQKLASSKELLAAIFGDGEYESGKACELLCQLVYLFSLYLRQHPPLLHCQLAAEVSKIQCGTEPNHDQVREEFCKFFTLVYTYVFDLILTGLLPKCPQPSQSCGVLLGTAEVKSGKIVQLCHTPRKYVWTFQNAAQLLLQKLFLSILDRWGRDGDKAGCCFDLPINCQQFAPMFAAKEMDMRAWVSSPVTAMRKVGTSLAQAFDIFDVSKVPSKLMSNVSRERLDTVMQAYRMKSTEARFATPPVPDPVTAILNSTLQPVESEVFLRDDEEGKTVSAVPALSYHPAYPRASFADGGNEEVVQLRQRLEAQQKQLDELTSRVNDMNPNR